MSDKILEQDGTEVVPDTVPAAEKQASVEAPCGCFRAVVKRMRPKMTPGAYSEGGGQAILGADGSFVMEEAEDIEEGYCEEHSVEMNRRQLEVQKALESGVPPEEAMLLMAAPIFELGASLVPGHDDPGDK